MCLREVQRWRVIQLNSAQFELIWISLNFPFHRPNIVRIRIESWGRVPTIHHSLILLSQISRLVNVNVLLWLAVVHEFDRYDRVRCDHGMPHLGFAGIIVFSMLCLLERHLLYFLEMSYSTACQNPLKRKKINSCEQLRNNVKERLSVLTHNCGDERSGWQVYYAGKNCKPNWN